jgi:hypothetical protein
MGCDIHAHLEYYETQVASDTIHTSCHASDISMGRNYAMFNLLAGVRGVNGPVFTLRGVPTKPTMSYQVYDKYYLKVLDMYNPSMSYPSTRYISSTEAENLVASGLTKYNENKQYVVNPNWHTPGFLYKKELIEIRRKYLINMIEYEASEYRGLKRQEALDTLENSSEVELMQSVFPSIECVQLNAVIASMIAIENSGNYQSRFVFWFDS